MEDGFFYRHNGFDLRAMHRALRVNIRAGRVRQGGSTITQQLAKNRFLTQERTVWRKMQEVFLTIELERQWGKERILHAYIACIPYGFQQQGVKEAADFYFHKRPDTLTLAESAALVALVPSPPEYRMNWKALQLRRGHALSRLTYFYWGRYTREQVAEAEQVPVDRLFTGRFLP